jgi:membrane protein YqaA with SNARE-associated domain
MRSFFAALFGSVLSWWGLTLIAVLDSSVFFFAPLAIDLGVIILSARSRELFWLYAILGTAGSVCGSVFTFYMGRRLGEAGLKYFVSEPRLKGFRDRIKNKGAVAVAVLNLAPPPFPFTAFVLAAGALGVNPARFFITLAPTRLLRFGSEALLAYFYGERIAGWFRSSLMQDIGIGLILFMLAGSVVTIIQAVRKTRAHRHSRSRKAA